MDQTKQSTINKSLTIAIPTYNRCVFLDENLKRIQNQFNDNIDILICDNASTDQTSEVVQKYLDQGLPIRYFKNTENFGWEKNFELCFKRSIGKYTMLIGDDDFIVENGIDLILRSIDNEKIDLLFCRAFGFDKLPPENKNKFNSPAKHYDLESFLEKTILQFRLLSSYVIKSEYIESSGSFTGNFAHLHVIFNVLLKGSNFSIINDKIIACKKDNSDFDQRTNFSDIYMKEFFELYRSYLSQKVSARNNESVERIMLYEYYPKYIFKMRINMLKNDPKLEENFVKIFSNHKSYNFLNFVFLKKNILTTIILFLIILYYQIIRIIRGY
ncbi:glycosyltransferase involved in cell wall biosynthesis [Aquimarina sp. EL_43]|uniref:glycosyltransferase family 2 protein n=1 Tax=unclassified Aquimarina TaxID=2627091 RepID=UPI0018C95DD4|nr:MULTISPECIES: glycosyltransferase family 2 protein [unclassified Aquimarina]MBG6131704.1 glycosyltransferase involved in cell wall biosynthesis [Aquimarina sp. EL_35]MBG6152165.1 glycosyltransferase involved in cell wall biosynthesis [Aquimarina sp. EL_32]MBG6169891.1 glycosyltransferase involved in cell wall biosynthesis [Aquimarina sp. EL_43]